MGVQTCGDIPTSLREADWLKAVMCVCCVTNFSNLQFDKTVAWKNCSSHLALNLNISCSFSAVYRTPVA
jgi:hypothetical protein